MELIRKFQNLSLQALINLLEDFLHEGVKEPKAPNVYQAIKGCGGCGGNCRCARGLSCCGGKCHDSGGSNCLCAKNAANN